MNRTEYNNWRNNWFRQSTDFWGWKFFETISKLGTEQDIPYLMYRITIPHRKWRPYQEVEGPVQAIITIAHRSKNKNAIIAKLTAHLL